MKEQMHDDENSIDQPKWDEREGRLENVILHCERMVLCNDKLMLQPGCGLSSERIVVSYPFKVFGTSF